MLTQYIASRLLIATLFVSATTLAVACSKNDAEPDVATQTEEPSPPHCEQGDTRECVGPGACKGGQSCDSAGSWARCECAASDGEGSLAQPSDSPSDAGSAESSGAAPAMAPLNTSEASHDGPDAGDAEEGNTDTEVVDPIDASTAEAPPIQSASAPDASPSPDASTISTPEDLLMRLGASYSLTEPVPARIVQDGFVPVGGTMLEVAFDSITGYDYAGNVEGSTRVNVESPGRACVSGQALAPSEYAIAPGLLLHLQRLGTNYEPWILGSDAIVGIAFQIDDASEYGTTLVVKALEPGSSQSGRARGLVTPEAVSDGWHSFALATYDADEVVGTAQLLDRDSNVGTGVLAASSVELRQLHFVAHSEALSTDVALPFHHCVSNLRFVLHN